MEFDRHTPDPAPGANVAGAQLVDQFLEIVTTGARIGLWSADVVTELFDCSDLDCALFGLDPAAGPFHFSKVLDTIHPDDREKTVAAWNAARTHDAHCEHVCRVIRGGEVRWLHMVGRLQHDDAGKPTRLVGISMDITEQRNAALALQEADRHKNEFLALLGHELRNRIAPIKTALQIQSYPGASNQARAKAVEIAQRQMFGLDRLVNELLDVGRISTGHFVLHWERIDVASFIADAIEMARPLIQEKHQQLAIQLPPDALFIDGDKDSLARAIGNLLTNAAKYSAPRGKITLRLLDAGDHVEISIQDEGAGISPEKAAHLFELFSRGNEASSRTEEGLGVGLYIVKTVVDLHGGTVSLNSAPGTCGASFTVWLSKRHAALPAAG